VSAIVNYSAKGEKKKYLMMVTRHGVVKKTPLEDFESIRRTGIIAISLKKGDQLKWAKLTGGGDQVVLATAAGAIHPFRREAGAPDGPHSLGRPRNQLKKQNDEVAGFDIIKGGEAKLLVVMENGFAKQTALKEIKHRVAAAPGSKPRR